MTSSEERREVAARLRENAGKHGGEQGPCPFCGSTDTSFVLNCVNDGEQSTTNWWASAINIAVILAILAWGGFFS